MGLYAKGVMAQRDAALIWCSGCRVRGLCLTHALEHREMHGVWGGIPSADRRRLIRWEKLVSNLTIPGAWDIRLELP